MLMLTCVVESVYKVLYLYGHVEKMQNVCVVQVNLDLEQTTSFVVRVAGRK